MLVPDDITIDILIRKLTEADCQNGFVLDGFPRTISQAKHLDMTLTEMGLNIDVVLSITLDDSSILRRIVGRRTCSECGMIYHVEDLPPETENVCDYCYGSLFQRSDDTQIVIEQRLQVYNKRTSPLIDYYMNMKNTKFIQIESEQKIDNTTSKAFKALGIPSPDKLKIVQIKKPLSKSS